MKIFKYEIEIDDRFVLSLPDEAKVLSVQMQGNTPCIWALVDPTRGNDDRWFRIYGTGHDILHPEKLKYIGTFQERIYVWHLFEEIST